MPAPIPADMVLLSTAIARCLQNSRDRLCFSDSGTRMSLPCKFGLPADDETAVFD